MATYTTNYNLEKPEATDPFGDFRQSYNDNMDIIDQNLGGGGGGGHTIVDENGSDMPAESKLQFTGNVSVSDDNVNGATVVDILGGGGNVYGFAIDESRKLFEGTMTNFTQTLEYTATEDAIALVDYSGSIGTNQWFLINGVIIPFQVLSSGRESFTVPIRKGDKISARHTSDNEGCFFHLACYGIKQGTNGIFAPVIYSDNERVIGVWRDNKPLYQKTFIKTLAGSPDVNGDSFLVANGVTGIDTLVKIDGTIKQYNNYAFFGYSGIAVQNIGWNYSFHLNPSDQLVVWTSGNSQCYSNLAGGLAVCTIQYTKTSDVAGSGNWNTDGVPTHHYSTSEQVVGTWIDGKPLYEKTVELTSLDYDTNWHDKTHGIADISTIVDVKAVCTTTDGYFYPVPTPRANTTLGFTLEFTATKISYVNNWISQPDKLYVTIQYTKTTD